MKNIIKYLPALLSILLFTSCLKADLDELPAFEEAEITSFKFEYRWIVKNGENDQLSIQELNVATEIDADNATIDCSVTVPSESADFPAEVRSQVTLSNLVGFCSISTAATMESVGSAPSLGIMADYSALSFQYEVTAANGTKKLWTVNISDFIK